MDISFLHKGIVFEHTGADPYSCENIYNHNHAPNITLLPTGDLFTAWYSGPCEGHHRQAILCSLSLDNGKTWSSVGVLQDTPNKADFDPAFVNDEQRIWLFYNVSRLDRYSLWVNKAGSLGLYCKYSDDYGKSWSNPVKISEGSTRANGLKLSNGDLLIGIYRGSKSAYVLKSRDRGQTWREYGPIFCPAGAEEPTIVELSNGALLMYLRTYDGYIWKTFSEDFGETWSEPTKTDIVASSSAHCLYKLSNGLIALAYNPCQPPYRTHLVLRLSRDDAATWSKPFVLDEIQGSRYPLWAEQVCYPSITQDLEGKLIVVWVHRVIAASEDPLSEHDVCWGDIKVARLSVK